MKVIEVVLDAEKQRVDAMTKVADAAKKRAKVAAANMQVNKAREKLRLTQKTTSSS